MKKNVFSIEKGLYLLALLLGGWIRFSSLGKIPLSELEAQLANQALHFFEQNILAGSHSLLITVMSVLFSMAKSSVFWARFLPALIGTSLIGLPYFYRDKLGQKVSLILAFLLAIDPTLIAASRRVGSPIIAIFFFIVTLAAVKNKKWNLAAIVLGLYVLSGADAFHGLVIGFLFFTAYYFTQENKTQFNFELELQSALKFIGIFITTYLITASCLFLAPHGISGAVNNIADWFLGWGIPSSVSISRLLISIPIYQPIALIFGLIFMIRSIRKDLKLGKILSLFTFLGLLLTMLYPNRQIFDLLWITIPLLTLASLELTQIFKKSENPIVATILSTGLIILGFFLWFNISAFARNNYSPDTNEFILQIAIFVIVFVLMFLAILMVSAGWSEEASQKGWHIAAICLLGLYSFAVGWRGTHDLERVQAEMWNEGLYANEIQSFEQTLADMSERAIGVKNGIPTEIRLVSQSLKWETRNQASENLKNIEFIITPISEEVESFSEDFRGQSFAIQAYPIWENQDFFSWIDWFVYRDIDFYQQEIIFWVPQVLFE